MNIFKTLICAAALSYSGGANAENISVGIIDTNAGHISSSENVNIIKIMESDYTGAAKIDASHGDMITSSLISGFHPTKNTKLTVYIASPFSKSITGEQNSFKIDYDKVQEALTSFANHGVKYVCIAYVTNDKGQSQRIVDTAQKLGLTIVASLGNGETSTPYPALLGTGENPIGSVIAVSSNQTPAKLRGLTHYHANGQSTFADYHYIDDRDDAPKGDSFATAYKCGELARNNKVTTNG